MQNVLPDIKMKGKIISGSGSVIALLYTPLIILAVSGFDRAGVNNRTANFFVFESGKVYAVLLFLFCVSALVLYYILISKSKNNAIGLVLTISFIIGVVLLILVVKINLVQKYLFDFYVSWFYHGGVVKGKIRCHRSFHSFHASYFFASAAAALFHSLL